MSASPPAPPRARWLAAALYALVVGYLLVRDLGVPPYDDAYFFKRFAVNALHHGAFAWNLDDGPVYGCTSQAFQLVATACVALVPTHTVAAIKLLSALCLVALGALLVRARARATAGTGDRSHRGPMIVLLGLGSPLVLTTVLTGMETAATLLVLAAVLLAMVPLGDGPTARGPRLGPGSAALLTVVVYLLRPDVALVPAVTWLGLHTVSRRRLPWRYCGALVVLMALLLAALWAYYGTPLPLSFHRKTLGLQPYGEHVLAADRQAKLHHLAAMLVFTAPLLWIAAHRRDRTNLALLGATVALWSYHLLLTHEIMGYRARFYVPGVVPLVLAAARGDAAFRACGRRPTLLAVVALTSIVALAHPLGLLPTEASEPLARIPWTSYVGIVLGAAWLLLPPARSRPWLELGVLGGLLVATTLAWKRPASFRLRSDAQLVRIHARQVTTARGLFDVARCLPQARTVYHSEMGITGLVLPRTRLVDLVGIVSDLRGEPFEPRCARDRPEAIFLPHRTYRELNAEIQRSPCLSSYRRVVQRSASPLHVRDDLAEPFLRCATEVHRFGVPDEADGP